MSAPASTNSRLAAAVIDSLSELGVTECVVGAGARNLPLLQALLLWQFKGHGRVWPFFEERSAAFFALGRCRSLGRPVAVLTTSGTASAELLPAAIEAHYAGHPLILVTADRPRRFRGSGAPQAIEQAALFGNYAATKADVDSIEPLAGWADSWSGTGPAHLNVCLEEPAASDINPGDWKPRAPSLPEGLAGSLEASDPDRLRVRDFCQADEGEGLLVMIGPDVAPADRLPLKRRLLRVGAPIWAEASSGLRESTILGHLLLRGGDRQLAALPLRRVLRIGGVPSSRLWRDLESRHDIEVLSLAPAGFSGLARESEVVSGSGALDALRGYPAAPTDWEASSAKSTASGLSGPNIDELCRRFPASECALVRRLSEFIASDHLIYLGNSQPLREWNLAASHAVAHANCFSSRGANGIDGQVSTFLGLSADSDGPCAWGVVGDLTALYDLSAPWVAHHFGDRRRRRLVVINNGGGRIFDRLPALAEADAFLAKTMRNPHACDLRHWADLWNLDYALFDVAQDWREPSGATAIIEIRPDEAQSEAFWKAWQARPKQEPES